MIADLQRRGITPDGCIVGEPTGMQPVVAHKGINVYECLLRGLATHSSLTPKGVNAIEYAARLICFIRDLADELRLRSLLEQGHSKLDARGIGRTRAWTMRHAQRRPAPAMPDGANCAHGISRAGCFCALKNKSCARTLFPCAPASWRGRFVRASQMLQSFQRVQHFCHAALGAAE